MSRGFFPHIISNNHSVNRLSNNTEYFLFPNSFVLLVIIPYSNYVWKVESFSVMRTHCGFSFRAGINSSAEREQYLHFKKLLKGFRPIHMLFKYYYFPFDIFNCLRYFFSCYGSVCNFAVVFLVGISWSWSRLEQIHQNGCVSVFPSLSAKLPVKSPLRFPLPHSVFVSVTIFQPINVSGLQISSLPKSFCNSRLWMNWLCPRDQSRHW